MDYSKISPNIFSAIYKAYEELKNSSINQVLKAMIELRVSQINECNYCIDLHTQELEKLGLSQERILAIEHPTSDLLDQKEKLAIKYADNITTNFDDEITKKKIHEIFDRKEIVDLTAIISFMNCLNRIAKNLKTDF